MLTPAKVQSQKQALDVSRKVGYAITRIMRDLTRDTILITGGAGFLGRQIVKQLQDKGVAKDRIVVVRKKDFDLTREVNVEKLFQTYKPTLIIHGAAVVGGIGANRNNPGRFFYENMMMGVMMMEYARQARVDKFVTLGTICAYPKFTPVPFNEDELWNGYPEETNAPYGIAKKSLLVQGQAYREQYDFNAIFLLPVNLYGPEDNFDPESSHVIPALIKKCVDARDSGAPTIEVWGTGAATREFLYVDDAARGIIMAAENYDGPLPVNLGSGMEISIRDLVKTIVELTHYKGEIRWNSAKPDGQPRRRLDVRRAKELFGFSAAMPFIDGLKKTISWYENNPTA